MPGKRESPQQYSPATGVVGPGNNPSPALIAGPARPINTERGLHINLLKQVLLKVCPLGALLLSLSVPGPDSAGLSCRSSAANQP